MSVRELDGIDDYLRVSFASTNFNSAVVPTAVLLIYKPLTNSGAGVAFTSWGRAIVGGSRGSIYQSSPTAYSWGSDDPSVDVNAIMNPTAAAWAGVCVSKPAGTSTPTMFYRTLAGASTTVTTLSSIAAAASPANDHWWFGAFAGATPSGYKDFRLATAALFQNTVSQAQFEAIIAAKSTLSIYSLSPFGLIDFNQASVATPVVDLMGNCTQDAINQTTVINGDDPPGWAFGTGITSSSDATGPGRAGQFHPHINYRMWF